MLDHKGRGHFHTKEKSIVASRFVAFDARKCVSREKGAQMQLVNCEGLRVIYERPRARTFKHLRCLINEQDIRKLPARRDGIGSTCFTCNTRIKRIYRVKERGA